MKGQLIKHRRRFTRAFKARVAREARHESVGHVARRNRIAESMVYRWRNDDMHSRPALRPIIHTIPVIRRPRALPLALVDILVAIRTVVDQSIQNLRNEQL